MFGFDANFINICTSHQNHQNTPHFYHKEYYKCLFLLCNGMLMIHTFRNIMKVTFIVTFVASSICHFHWPIPCLSLLSLVILHSPVFLSQFQPWQPREKHHFSLSSITHNFSTKFCLKINQWIKPNGPSSESS